MDIRITLFSDPKGSHVGLYSKINRDAVDMEES